MISEGLVSPKEMLNKLSWTLMWEAPAAIFGQQQALALDPGLTMTAD